MMLRVKSYENRVVYQLFKNKKGDVFETQCS